MYCATANPTSIILAKLGDDRKARPWCPRCFAPAPRAGDYPSEGRARRPTLPPPGSVQGILGVVDGLCPTAFETPDDQKARKDFLRMIGYKR